MKMILKLKINPIREYLGLIIYPIKQSAGLFFLIKSPETIPLRSFFVHNNPRKIHRSHKKYFKNGLYKNTKIFFPPETSKIKISLNIFSISVDE
jgi:hypothetical protein